MIDPWEPYFAVPILINFLECLYMVYSLCCARGVYIAPKDSAATNQAAETNSVGIDNDSTETQTTKKKKKRKNRKKKKKTTGGDGVEAKTDEAEARGFKRVSGMSSKLLRYYCIFS